MSGGKHHIPELLDAFWSVALVKGSSTVPPFSAIMLKGEIPTEATSSAKSVEED